MGGHLFRTIFRGSIPFCVSMVVHLSILLTLAFCLMPEVVTKALPVLVVNPFDAVAELETVELDQSAEAATQLNFATSSVASMASEISEPTDPALAQEVVSQDPTETKVSVEGLLDIGPSRRGMLVEVPHGAAGTARAVVDGYGQAIDRITQEIMWNLSDSKVLVIWCFDQSESMKDDQQDIRERIERVYQELGLTSVSKGDALATAVVSYGKDFQLNTPKPTSNLDEIREAIDSIPVDTSGEEVMCQAVGRAISTHRTYVNRTQRRMMLVLVTDESGNSDENFKYLESVISEAKAARCKIYVLGREAVFGYPYAFMRWKHPQTERIHWLRINRGPETAFVEQVQTNGFSRRHDAFPSGYGPYEQSRLAKQTSGIFFLLPSVETNLVRGKKRRYQLEAMRGYRPDLRARQEIFADRNKSPLQMLIWGIISDLSPYNKEAAKVTELRVHFSRDTSKVVQQIPKELAKINPYVAYLAKAEKQVEKSRRLRDDDPSLRWQANYDLLLAQLVAYRVRAHEYAACLQEFAQSPRVVPMMQKSRKFLTRWDITTQRETRTGDLVHADIERADRLLAAVIETHPGTPWAALAERERARGYGVKLYPFYEYYKEVDNPIPLPKL